MKLLNPHVPQKNRFINQNGVGRHCTGRPLASIRNFDDGPAASTAPATCCNHSTPQAQPCACMLIMPNTPETLRQQNYTNEIS